jgi:hypothetical protein
MLMMEGKGENANNRVKMEKENEEHRKAFL